MGQQNVAKWDRCSRKRQGAERRARGTGGCLAASRDSAAGRDSRGREDTTCPPPPVPCPLLKCERPHRQRRVVEAGEDVHELVVLARGAHGDEEGTDVLRRRHGEARVRRLGAVLGEGFEVARLYLLPHPLVERGGPIGGGGRGAAGAASGGRT